MGMDENDHVQWMRRQAGNFRKAAEGEADEKKRRNKEAMAARLLRAAEAMEMALAGSDPNAMGGHQGLMKRLRPGARVGVKMMTGEEFVGEIRAMGKYDFALKTTDRGELVVSKHGVAYFNLLRDGEEEAN